MPGVSCHWCFGGYSGALAALEQKAPRLWWLTPPKAPQRQRWTSAAHQKPKSQTPRPGAEPTQFFSRPNWPCLPGAVAGSLLLARVVLLSRLRQGPSYCTFFSCTRSALFYPLLTHPILHLGFFSFPILRLCLNQFPFEPIHSWYTMASVTRLSNSALKASLRAPVFGARSAAFNSVRCYSAKTQVRLLPRCLRRFNSRSC